MKNRNRRWLLAWTLTSLFPNIILYEVAKENESTSESGLASSKERVFAPRMDYEQWTPLGRGDPLKNDPTYDYVPPVLDRVHYWMDPASRKPDAPLPGESKKTEILVLGISSKKPSTGTSVVTETRRDHYLKPQYPRLSRPYYPMPYFPYKSKQNDFVGNKGEHRIPYTILMPPPLPTKNPSLITFEQAYNSLSTEVPITQATTSVVTNDPSSFTIEHLNLLYQASTLGNENEFKEPESSLQDASSSNKVTWKTPFDNFISSKKPSKLQVEKKYNSTFTNNLVAFNNEISSFVKKPEVMHKGLVTDDNFDIQNSYVNIGKPEAQMHPPTDMEINSVSVQPPKIVKPPVLRHPLIYVTNPPTIQTLQTMLSKPTTSLQNLIRKDTSKKKLFPTLKTTPSTTPSSFTTDPLFKHYKQPAEPIKGPLYVIIQGHSKVKTYGPAKQIHGISVQESNEIPTSEDEKIYDVKHLHNYKKDNNNNEGKLRQGRSNDLQTLSHVVKTGLGAIDLSESNEKRRIDDVQETELVVGYDVSLNATSERYYKGIVEEGDVARSIKDTNKT